MSRYAHMAAALGPELFQKVQDAKILMVGAGGIGCELVKNLVLSGFQHIVMIDLDTIDVSNLNRQFLFRKEHVGKSKAQVAKESMLKLNPDLDITAHHGNIKDPQFGADFFKEFTLVINALDNLEARRHVNRVCLGTNVNLLESGTQGYLGQATSILHGAGEDNKSECFECVPQPDREVSYAVCTLRNTPDKPHHCIVWAEKVYAVLFGPPDDDNIMNDFKTEITAYSEADAAQFARFTFDKLFRDEIFKQLEAKERWTNRAPPTPLNWDDLMARPEIPLNDQMVPTEAQCVRAYLRATQRIFTERKDNIGSMTFDKDDEHSLDWVTAASNLRMAIYSIPMQSKFELKGTAGRIVHAIATTNAIAAGLLVLEAIKVLDERWGDCRTTWIKRQGPKVLMASRLEKPNKDCLTCGKSLLKLRIDPDQFTFKQLFRKVAQKALAMATPAFDTASEGKQGAYYGTLEECEESGFNLDATFAQLKIPNGCFFNVEDDDQLFRCSFIVEYATLSDEEFPEGFQLIGSAKPADSTSSSSSSPSASSSSTSSSASSVDLTVAVGDKRSFESSTPNGQKRQKTVEATREGESVEDDDLVIL